MSDKYEYLKKVIDKLHFGKYYESDFSSTDVEIAMRELKAICQSLPLLSPDVQVGQQKNFLHFPSLSVHWEYAYHRAAVSLILVGINFSGLSENHSSKDT